MESLPNSVSKVKSLKTHCQDKLAEAFSGKMEQLPPAVVPGDGKFLSAPNGLISRPNSPFSRSLHCASSGGMRIPAKVSSQVKFLFDANVLGVLDLESLLFTCEQLTDRLLEAVVQFPKKGPPSKDLVSGRANSNTFCADSQKATASRQIRF